MNRILTLLLITLACTACSQEKKQYSSPPGYNLTQPEIFNMPEELFEISGIAFQKNNKEDIYAIQDEDGYVFQIQPGKKELKTTQFAKHGDFEDIAITNFYFIILRSDGTFFTFPLENIKEEKASKVREFKNLLPPGEYEGLFADRATNQIFALCKNCIVDKKTTELSGYVLQQDNNGEISIKNSLKIDVGTIARLSGNDKIKFRPSALAIHPDTKEWYILSSVNKMLVVTDSNWKVKKIYKLNPSLFNQPEGITFDIENNLYISNEGGQTPAGTILKFRWNRSNR